MQEGTSSTKTIQFIKAAEKDPSVRAIIFDINSPGGSAVASEEIAHAIKESTKYKVAVIRDLGASGAYWIASSSDVIFASRMSLTGSIGVISSFIQFEGLMDKYGISYERLVAGERKDIGSPFREMTDEERILFQKKINTIHEYFINENGKKSLRKYTEPINLSMFDDRGWMTSKEEIWYISEYLTEVEHIPILNRSQLASLRVASLTERKSGEIVQWIKKGDEVIHLFD